MVVIPTLRAIPFLEVLPDEEIAALAHQAHRRQYRAGATIFYRDDPGSTLYVIQNGRVKLVLTSPEGREVTVDIVGPGDFFGELALVDGGPRSATAVALEPVEAFTLNRGLFIAILERHPQAMLALLAVVGDRLRRTDEMLQDVLFLDLPARLAKQLLALAEQHGAPTPEGIRLDMRLSQSELAAIVGTTRESINRCLNAFADRDILALDRDAIILLAPEKLRLRIY